MKVQAKCTTPAWDCPILYRPGQGPLPGGLYEIDSEGALAKMELRPGVFVFEFDREAAAKSSDPLSSASPAGDLTPPSAGEVTPGKPKETVDRRGIGPRNCKGCGQSFQI